ncbi:hypothetical protein Tco_0664037, partial [Tanacetum coccineum]
YLSSKARNRALLARLKTLETHMSRMKWQRQSAEDLVVKQMMRTQVLEARAQIDMALLVVLMVSKMESIFHISGCTIDNQVKFATCTLLGAALTWWNSHLANDLMDQKLRTYTERQNDNKRKAGDSPRNNQQQQPHKKQNVSGHLCWALYHGVIICNEKIVRVPFGKDKLIFQGDRSNQRKESRLNIISCTRAQKYLSKGYDIFLGTHTTKEAKDTSEGKRLEDVPIIRYFPEDLPGIPPAR